MSEAYFVYTSDERNPALVTRNQGEALAAFITAVNEGEFEHVRLDYSS